jgi:hypothetical protein
MGKASPIKMDYETREFLKARLTAYRGGQLSSAKAIAADLSIPQGTTMSWVIGRQAPNSEHMPRVLELLGLYARGCERCQSFMILEVNVPTLCPVCSRLHVLRDGKVFKK